jgi:hypothetical protein
MDFVKDAFQKVKQDIDFLKNQLSLLSNSIVEKDKELSYLKEENIRLLSKITVIEKSQISPTQNPEKPTNLASLPTQNPSFKLQKAENLAFSTGNEGVPTDRQTDRQTDQQTENSSLSDAFDILNSLDSIKKEIRNKFKRITDQEFLVFSTIYQLSEMKGYVEYKDLSIKLNLTESSIRDYVGRLIKKGIPVEKTKINNKIIQLSISNNLKKITPLPVIFKLRDI